MAGGVPSDLCLKRLKKDIQSFHEEPLRDVYISANEKNIQLIHALIVGPPYSPYLGGFFYVRLKVPPDYPMKPPDPQLMTTGGGEVLFNPRIYRNGKMCLWHGGYQWSASKRLRDILLSIFVLFYGEEPLFQESGTKQEIPGESDRYNEILEHETRRVAVCDMLEGKTMDSRGLPQSLRDIMERRFLEFYDHYVSVANSKSHLNGKPIRYPAMLDGNGGSFDYASILKRLHCIKKRLEAKLGNLSNTE